MAEKETVDEAFLREVDEELRREQMTGWWRRWGRYLLFAVGAGFLALAGYLWWREEQTKKAGALAEQLTQAFNDIDAGNDDQAKSKLAALVEARQPGYRAAALLTEGDLALKAQDTAKAAATFRKVAGDDSLPQPYRDLALVRQTAAEFDSLKPEEVIARLKPLAVEGNPWFASAAEMVAISYLNQNKPELAGPLFGAIARDADTPPTLRARAGQLAGVLGVDLGEAAGGTPEAVR